MRKTRDPVERFWKHVNFFGPTKAHMLDCCWLWEGTRRHHGYGAFNVDSTVYPNEIVQTHRWVYEETYGKIRGNYDVAHKCDVKFCVRPSHLEKVRHSKNMADAATRGLTTRGEQHYSAKLTDEKVVQLREFHSRLGVTPTELARLYGVCPQVIRAVVERRSWRHVA